MTTFRSKVQVAVHRALLLVAFAGAYNRGAAVRADTPAARQAPAAQPAGAPKALTVESLLAARPETASLKRMVGVWDVTMTMRLAPDAAPVVVREMIAERTMFGLYLTETMRAAPSSKLPDFRRTDYLTYDPVQARWEYVSMDTRSPIGIMFAKSFASGAGSPNDDITLYFDNFANPGLGPVGGSVRARQVDSHDGDDRSFKRQYWTRPGDAEWLAIEYAYVRRK